jgi:hypothetical protein
MKRHSITSIIMKVHFLSVTNDRNNKEIESYMITKDRIVFAAVNEIIRLHAEDKSDLEASNSHLKGLAANMEAGSDSLFEAVKVICEDYNSKILKP